MATKKTRRSGVRPLTVLEVQKAVSGDHFDGDGLILRIRGESAAWVFRYSSPLGKRREMGFGPATRGNAESTGKSLSAIREIVDDARRLIARGEDPIEAKHAKNKADRERHAAVKVAKQKVRLTLARAARDYHARVIEPRRTPKHAAQWIASLENHLGDALWNSPIATIEQDDLLDRLIELNNDIPETASRIRQRLEAIFDDAIFRREATANPAAIVKRKLREVGSKQKPGHFRALAFPEVPAFWIALAAQNGTAAKAFQFLILTASRTGEALGASFDEFNLDTSIWRIPPERMKAGEEHIVNLSPHALAIIKGQQANPNADPRWVFRSPTLNGKALSNMALLILLRRMELNEKTTAHGLRATFSTWANESGRYRADVIEACLAHREGDLVRRAYNRAQFAAERRQLLLDWAAFVTSGAT